ncbi:glycine/betaine ABC transporter [Salipaludibacillus agaradhaerens]|uniref:glycine betaine ABC transporter substrate-binding protein n=1 Tax=Salipaludibacillus agaradhaerens TaxID=76935 RepID=UPI002151CD7A|nr:glycine betaine ABC transporter substrate-binding protein [Salipaludibacillus agaradhaerens]MCR6105320.1 glycine/betaine ABC transporter [Salipaludibacillus agaradhaerens]MCR6117361.1 glycine/betaine ABC transporter [Salipaludibacillus agaradhaerens]UJW56557.1 glycine/betaine ABC transporter [Bacillus sp. A116_S68]
MKMKKLGVLAGMSLALIAAGCGTNDGNNTENNNNNEGAGADVGEELNYTITGIDAGAGIMGAAEEALDVYGLDEWQVQASSDAAMTQALGDAYDNEEPIIVTGWTPHWKFAAYDLKYLEDPEGVFGEAEDIHTFVREGLEEDMPEAYQVLDNFQWTEEDMGEIMMDIQEGTDDREAARAWVEENEDKVNEWTEGVDPVDGETIDLVFVAWDSEIASTNMIAVVLEDLGYEVNMDPLEANFMFQAVAEGEADAMVAAWLPGTHSHLLEDYGDDMIDLGANLEGAAIGLVVPEYMDIDSIEDLQ